jgi:hypothetical protein
VEIEQQPTVEQVLVDLKEITTTLALLVDQPQVSLVLLQQIMVELEALVDQIDLEQADLVETIHQPEPLALDLVKAAEAEAVDLNLPVLEQAVEQVEQE